LRGLARLVFLLALAVAPAAHAGVIAGPALDAAALRAARDAAPGPQLHLVFDLHRGQAAPVPLVVTLGTDYVDWVEEGRETLYDFRLRRRLMLDRKARSFANLSLYGDVAFRRFELGKRIELAKMYGEAMGGEPPLELLPFWIESDVGLIGAAKVEPKIVTKHLPDGAVSFRFGNEEIALFAPANEAVPEELRKSFARFLRLKLPVHPQILAAVALDGRLPKRLVYVSDASGTRHPVGLVLRSSVRATGDYPLPADFAPRPLAGQAQDQEALGLRGLLPLMLQAVAGKAAGGPRSLASYRRAADQSLKQGHAFAAALLLAESALQYGADAGDCTVGPGGVPCHDAAELGRIFAADPRAATLFKAQIDEPKDPKAAVALWNSIKRDDVADGYVIDAFLADRLSAEGLRQQAMGAFARALQGNPYLAGVYRELGDHFLRASRTDLAWLCYDLGRVLPGRDPHDPLAAIDDLEHEIAADDPEFF
jgi:tetratricopeptide (TPR) repeat protein